MNKGNHHLGQVGLLLVSLSAVAGPTTTLWFDQPAKSFQSSLPLGNGRIGAMVFGAVDDERIVLNESSVWSGSRADADRPNAHTALPEIRRLLLEGKNMEAEALVNQNFTCRGPGSGHGSGANVPFGCYQVLGNLRLRSGGSPALPRPRCVSGHHAYFPNQEIEFSADGNPETKWCVIHEGRPVQWQIDAGKAVAAHGYSFTSAEDVPERDPRTWKLEGSPDGSAWVVLDEHNQEPVFEQRHQRRDYTIGHPVSYRHFRLTFQPNSGVEHFQISEIAIEGVTTSTPETAPGVTGYRRELDLATATVRIQYERDGVRFGRTHFVSAADQVFVSRLTASRPGFDLVRVDARST